MNKCRHALLTKDFTLFSFEGAKPTKLVFLTVRVHPFPFRTRKLSSPVPTILVWRRTGKIGQRQHKALEKFSGAFSRSFARPLEALDAGKGEKSLYMTRQNECSKAAGYGGERQAELVLLTVRVHPFPFRTRKLSSPVPTILVWRRTGKIGQRQYKEERQAEKACLFSIYTLS